MTNQFGLYLLEVAAQKNRVENQGVERELEEHEILKHTGSLEKQCVRGISFVPNYFFRNIITFPNVSEPQNSMCLRQKIK